MTAPAILVLTTVHTPDDTRIRERLVRSLEEIGRVTYATRVPGPSDMSGLSWARLPGGRIRRNLAALMLLVRGKWDIAILHDPETIPAGVLARLTRRAVVVFDVHEDLPAQIAYKDWVPAPLAGMFRGIARGLYRLAERFLVLTLAEPGYDRLFDKSHPVFPNFPRSSSFPAPLESGDGSAVYVGDITRARGLEDALEATARSGIRFVAVGRGEETLVEAMTSRARDLNAELELTGPVSNPEALKRMSVASVGLSPLRDEANYRHSLPTKTLEYLAMGIPVVASDLPGTRAVLEGLDAVWLVPPGDIDAMASAFVQAVRPEVKRTAVEQVTELRTRFRWPEDEVRAFYSALAGQRGIPAPN